MMDDNEDDADEDNETDLTDLLEEAREEAEKQASSSTSPFGMAGMAGIGFDFEPDRSEEVELGMRLLQAGHTLNEFVDYAEEHDIDMKTISPMELHQMDYEQRVVVYGFISMSSGFERLESLISDDDDDSPFKVSDGDDPVF